MGIFIFNMMTFSPTEDFPIMNYKCECTGSAVYYATFTLNTLNSNALISNYF